MQGFNNLKPHWRGLGKSHIFFIPKGKIWRLESFYATEKVRSTKWRITIHHMYDDSMLTTPRTTRTPMPTTRLADSSGRSSMASVRWGILYCLIVNCSNLYQMEGGAPRSLTLTTCFPNKFTCNDGTCVRINQRCNLVVDCPDKSDEKVVHIVLTFAIAETQNVPLLGLRYPAFGRGLPWRAVPP